MSVVFALVIMGLIGFIEGIVMASITPRVPGDHFERTVMIMVIVMLATLATLAWQADGKLAQTAVLSFGTIVWACAIAIVRAFKGLKKQSSELS